MRQHNYASQQLVFDTKQGRHTINGIQFGDEHANLSVMLGATEEWTIKNAAIEIDHPLHIHINPFQVVDFFDPNEKLINPTTGLLEAVLKSGKSQAIARFVTTKAELTDPANAFAKRQCFIDPDDPATWSQGGARSLVETGGVKSVTGPCAPQTPAQAKSVWWDVFAIPAGRKSGTAVIPGYFKMRSRFVDFPGTYVTHCHILIHEDRGMMFSVEVFRTKPTHMQHH